MIAFSSTGRAGAGRHIVTAASVRSGATAMKRSLAPVLGS
jgi:hypothetical protein